jgi:hypothetical protein
MTQTFTLSCPLPYDRHHYKLVYLNGKQVVFDNYEDIKETWWNTESSLLSHVEVLDLPTKPKKGFK